MTETYAVDDSGSALKQLLWKILVPVKAMTQK